MGLLGEDDPGVGRGQLGQLLGWVESRLEEADRVRLSRDLDADAELRDLVDGMRADRAALQHRGESGTPHGLTPVAWRHVLCCWGLKFARTPSPTCEASPASGDRWMLAFVAAFDGLVCCPRPGSSWFNRSATASVQSTATWPPPGLQAYPRPQRPVAVQSRPEQSPREGEAVATFFCRVPAGLMAEGMLEPIALKTRWRRLGSPICCGLMPKTHQKPWPHWLIGRGAFRCLAFATDGGGRKSGGEAAVLDFVAAQRLVQQCAEQARRSVVAKVPLQLR